MAAGSHLLRRDDVYYWRRKTPVALVQCRDRRHLFMSLRTWSPIHARQLAVQLDAFLDDLTMMPDARLLSQTQIDGMLREVLTRHLEKLERGAAAAKLSRDFDRDVAERDDRWVAWVYRLLEAKGPQAQVSASDREAILADGLGETEVGYISAHLDRLRKGGSVPTKHHLLRPLLESQDAEPTAMNLAQAQQIYFLGMRLALERTEARYRGVRVDSSALVDGIMRLNAEQRLAAMTAGGHPDQVAYPGPAKGRVGGDDRRLAGTRGVDFAG